MDLHTEHTENELIFFISGEIDHHRTLSLRTQMDEAIRREMAPAVVLDLAGTEFCDSSALGLILGRVRVCRECGSEVSVRNPSARVRKILDLAGAFKYLNLA